jgi:hypothetical protein
MLGRHLAVAGRQTVGKCQMLGHHRQTVGKSLAVIG